MALNYAREAYPKMIKKGNKFTNLKKMTFKNGSKIISRPVGSTGDSVRGFEGGVLIVDEASRSPKFFWIAAKPVILTSGTGEIWMCSTPYGKQGYFWDKFNEAHNLHLPEARFKVFHKTTIDVMTDRPISADWTKQQREGALRILAEEERDMSALEYGQEFSGLFLEDLRQLISDDLIDAALTLKREDVKRKIDGDYYLGIDCAGMGEDENVLTSVERLDENTINQVDIIITKKKRTTETFRLIKDMDSVWDYRKIYIDDGGLGYGIFCQCLESEQVKRKIVPINNASRSLDAKDLWKKKILKEDLYTNLLRLLEAHKLHLFNEPEIRLSLKSIQYEIKNGRTRIFGNYTHITEAIIRSLACTLDKFNKLWCY